MITLWGRADSLNVQKASWILHELGLDHDRKDVGGPFGGLDTPEFLAKNPNGLIPVLEDGDVVLWESHAIVRHLARTRDAGGLWPSTPIDQAKADQWMDWVLTVLWPPIRTVFLQQFRTPEDKRDAALITANLTQSEGVLNILDDALETGFLANSDFTAADLVVGTVVNRFLMLKDRSDLPRHVQAWFEPITARPAFKKTFNG